MTKSNKPPLHTVTDAFRAVKSSNTIVYWIKVTLENMELQLTEGTKKRTEYEFKKKKKITLPFQETHFTDVKKETSQASSHQTLSMWSAFGQDKEHTKQDMFLFIHDQKKQKKTTTTDRQIKVRFCWPSTTDHTNSYTKENQFWNNSTCSWWANILCTLNSFVIQCFCNSFTLQEVGWTRFVTLKTHWSPLSCPWDTKKKGTL